MVTKDIIRIRIEIIDTTIITQIDSTTTIIITIEITPTTQIKTSKILLTIVATTIAIRIPINHPRKMLNNLILKN